MSIWTSRRLRAFIHIVVSRDGSYTVKDDDVLDDRVAEGRYSPELVEWIRAYGNALTERLQSEGPWWDLAWAEWDPPGDDWKNPQLPQLDIRNSAS